MSVKKNIDFFEQIRADSEISSRSDKRVPLVLPFCTAILLVLICWWVFSWLGLNAGRRLSAIGAALSGVTEPAGASSGYNGPEIEDILRMELDYKDSNRLTRGRLKEVFALQPDDLSVLGVTYYDKVITINGWSKRELCGADFAKLLRGRPDAFYGVNYDGVTASGDGYGFTVSFSLAGEIY